jgi:uncharacterized protein YggE
MSKKLIGLVFALILLISLAACQAAPVAAGGGGSGLQPRMISVNGMGKIYLTPDVAYIYIGVQSQDENVGNALTKNNEKAQSIAAKLQELGVDAKDIQTSSFNIYPTQQYSPEGQPTVMLYTVDNTVNVTVRDLTLLGKLLDEVVRVGANSINGINFDVIDRTKAVSDARKLAISDARTQADEIAQAAGVQVDQLYNMSVYLNDAPAPMYDNKGGSAMAVGQVPVAAGQMVITVNVSASYTIK